MKIVSRHVFCVGASGCTSSCECPGCLDGIYGTKIPLNYRIKFNFQGHFQPQLKFSPFNWLLKSSARSGSVSAAPVKVSVYYESLCPDSQLFVYDQLAPTFEIFGPEELVVDLKPFGKANVTIFGISF